MNSSSQNIEELTICTVSFGHKSLIEENIRIVDKLNQKVRVKWIIVENTPAGKGERFSVGVNKNISVIEGQHNSFSGIASASKHHASGLHLALGQVATRFVLILDPDFYIVRKDWIQEALAYMKDRGLAFWGAPYNPKRYRKYRYFPCIHCMLIDLKKVPKADINFDPQYDEVKLMSGREKSVLRAQKKNSFLELWEKLKRPARLLLKRGAIIGSSRDTGYRLFEYSTLHRGLNAETVEPVFKYTNSDINPRILASWPNRFIEWFLSESLCYLPKNNGYFVVNGFRESHYPDVFQDGYDEFIWKGSPFGFHLQGARKDGTVIDRSKDIAAFKVLLDTCLESNRPHTLFISLFEGVESKNLLRTGVIQKIIEKSPNSRLVLFVKNKERAEYYAKEFTDPRLIFEVVAPYELTGLSKNFSSLKFNFLQTKTTDIRARIIAENRGQLYYYFSLASHRLLSNRLCVSIFRLLDKLFVQPRHFDEFFKKYSPDLVFLANIYEDFETDFLKAAKQWGVKNIALINSWDRATARCVLRVLPDDMIVFNPAVRDQMIQHHYMPRSRIYISGLPQYDIYARPPSISRDNFLAKLGIPGMNKIIVYSPIGGMFSNSDWEIMDKLHELRDQGKFGPNISILVRFSPNDFIKEEDLKKRPNLLYQMPGVRFSKVRTTDWEMTERELDDLHNTMYHMSLIVCYASSISIDAAVLDKPVINVGFEVKDNGTLAKSPTIFYGMTHYAHALATGGIKLVKNEEELVTAVCSYLKDPTLDSLGRNRLVDQQCFYTDGGSAERVAAHIVSFV